MLMRISLPMMIERDQDQRDFQSRRARARVSASRFAIGRRRDRRHGETARRGTRDWSDGRAGGRAAATAVAVAPRRGRSRDRPAASPLRPPARRGASVASPARRARATGHPSRSASRRLPVRRTAAAPRESPARCDNGRRRVPASSLAMIACSPIGHVRAERRRRPPLADSLLETAPCPRARNGCTPLTISYSSTPTAQNSAVRVDVAGLDAAPATCRRCCRNRCG